MSVRVIYYVHDHIVSQKQHRDPHLGLWNFTDYFKRFIGMGFEVYCFFYMWDLLVW